MASRNLIYYFYTLLFQVVHIHDTPVSASSLNDPPEDPFVLLNTSLVVVPVAEPGEVIHVVIEPAANSAPAANIVPVVPSANIVSVVPVVNTSRSTVIPNTSSRTAHSKYVSI